MQREFELELPPEIALVPEAFDAFLQKTYHLSPEGYQCILAKQSIDARSKQIKVLVSGRVLVNEPSVPLITYSKDFVVPACKGKVAIIGFGPAGMFAALQLLELGYQPIVLERGKDVRSRRRDLAAINKDHVVNENSNYCFGEGGAGTYSDGKLYTRSNKRGNLRRVLEILVAHGATEKILYEAHPHIGTNKLPQIVAAIRETIVQKGGEIHFEEQWVDFTTHSGKIRSIISNKGNEWHVDGVILATGHSARDVYQLLFSKGIQLEAKPFAMGVRVEHPQAFVDFNRYRREERGVLPPASYALVEQTYFNQKQRGVFSFCMCPGGFIVPSATSQPEVVVNGMSPSRRDSKFANSGIVVAIELEDMQPFDSHGPLKGMYFQKSWEERACISGGNTQAAPAQRLGDFITKTFSQNLPDSSYQPGLHGVHMDDVVGEAFADRLRNGFKGFEKKMKGFITNEAVIVGVESRTSSPVRIPRLAEELHHPQLSNLYPCGEGGGFAGGIVSAAMDGENVAVACVKALSKG